MYRPISYGVLLYPGFEVLDIAGPLECLNTLTHRSKDDSDLTLSIIARPSPDDPDATAPVNPANPDPSGLGAAFQSKQVYMPTHTFSTAPPLDILMIPGGFGSLPPNDSQPEVDFIRATFPSLKYLFTICTGSLLAARAGVLDGHKATCNKAVWPAVKEYKKTFWVAKARWVQSGNIWTTSGVSAGTDGMLAFLESVYGNKLVTEVVNGMEYMRVEDADCDPFAEIYGATNVEPEQ